MFTKKELTLIIMCIENEKDKYKDSMFNEKTRLYQSIIDKCKKTKDVIVGTIKLDDISNKYKFTSDSEEAFLLSCGTKIALNINNSLLDGRVEHTGGYYCFLTNDNKIAIPLIDIKEEIYYIKS